MQQYSRAVLSKYPDRIMVSDGELPESRLAWVQPFDMWSLFLLGHEGLFSADQYSFAFEPGCVAIVPPGKRCAFDRVGQGTDAYVAIFNLGGDTVFDVAAIPVISDLGKRAEYFTSRYKESAINMTWTICDARAWIWDLLWSVAKPPDFLRQSPLLYRAEEYIFANMGNRMSVREIALVSDVSPGHLLRLFRAEHGATVQQYIRDLRVAEARRLLTNTDDPIKAIAHSVGLADLQYFNKLIKTSTGFPPRELRMKFGKHRRHVI